MKILILSLIALLSPALSFGAAFDGSQPGGGVSAATADADYLQVDGGNAMTGQFNGQASTATVGGLNVKASWIKQNDVNVFSSSATNVKVGFGAGTSSGGDDNTMIGSGAGENSGAGSINTFFGRRAGRNNTLAGNNTFIGGYAGENNSGAGASANVFFGVNAGNANTDGDEHVFIGNRSGLANTTGAGNTFIGKDAGINNISGSRNIFLGTRSGTGELLSDKLYIDPTGTGNPLIYGDFASPEYVNIGGSFSVNRSTGQAPAGKLHVSSGAAIIDGAGASLTISSGTPIRNFLAGSGAVDCSQVNLATVGQCSVAAAGVNSSDLCSVQADSLEANLSITISSASLNVVAFRLNNPTVGNIDPASQTYRWWCFRP